MHYQPNGGWIELVCGSMFSGKTEELLRRVRRVEIARKKLQIFKPAIDNRYGLVRVASHSGIAREDALIVGSSAEILALLKPDTQVIAIDEVQFFDAGIVAVCDELANRGLCVIVAGLDQDFRGEPFGPMPLLLASAERIDCSCWKAAFGRKLPTTFAYSSTAAVAAATSPIALANSKRA